MNKSEFVKYIANQQNITQDDGLIKIWIDSIFYHCIIRLVNYKRWLCLDTYIFLAKSVLKKFYIIFGVLK